MAFGCRSSRSFLLPVCLFHDLLQTGIFEAWRCQVHTHSTALKISS